jgi:hypothetical protein
VRLCWFETTATIIHEWLWMTNPTIQTIFVVRRSPILFMTSSIRLGQGKPQICSPSINKFLISITDFNNGLIWQWLVFIIIFILKYIKILFFIFKKLFLILWWLFFIIFFV